ncbi:MAG TPA: ParB N-terminal domain-containing protein [Xanthobacteraceae bacterium]
MARLISRKFRPDQDRGGDKTPLTPLAETKAIAKALMEFHPFAAKFPLMEGKEFDELVKDISTNGLMQPIIKHEGQILDGRNRYRACLRSGVAPIFHTFSGDDPLAFVISANLHRRHLTPKQKRDVIAALIKAAPEKSNREIGKTAKAHHATVGAVRDELGSTGQIDQLEKTKGADGKSRKAKKPKSNSKPKSRPAADDGPEPKDGKTVSAQSFTTPGIESPCMPEPAYGSETVPAARKPSLLCEAVDRLVDVLGAIQFVDAVRELTPDECEALSIRVDTARRYLGNLKDVLMPARPMS